MRAGVRLDDILPAAIHDAKNSLGVVLSRLDEVSGHCPGGDPRLPALLDARYEIQRINANLVRMLTLHKFHQQGYGLDISLHAVADLLHETVLTHKAVIDGRGIAVEVVCADDLHWYFDYNLLLGVLGNALNNAIRYTHSRVRLSAQAGAEAVAILAEDDGPGFPESMLAHPAVTRAPHAEHGFISGNTGLGLYFSELVAQMHRNRERCGHISLQNAGSLGGGCFGIHLP
ncbi:MAG: HAMP domain-containing histidine kinase [Gammaproteobacteria bacterium]|nr:HAMP domain-containing histidine kinase [Gammaproteobacteria bacterium]